MDADPDAALGPADRSYDRWLRSVELLEQRNPEAAATVLATLRQAEPTSRAVLEALARALFDARRYDAAAGAFADLAEVAPDDDYAHFGLGLSLWRLQRFREAVDPLAMAVAMRPDRPEYANALAQVRATLRARQAAGLAADARPSATGGGARSTGTGDSDVPW